MGIKKELLEQAVEEYFKWRQAGNPNKFKRWLYGNNNKLYYDLLELFKNFEDAYKEIIKTVILKLHKEGTDLSREKMKTTNAALYGSAKRFFGSWERAIEASGLDYNEILRSGELARRKEKQPLWTKARIIYEIRAHFMIGFDLSPANLDKQCYALFVAAQKLFGSWEKAIRAAGLYYCLITKKTNVPDSITVIRIWHNVQAYALLLEIVKNGGGIEEIMKKFRRISENSAVELFCLAVAQILLDQPKEKRKEILEALKENKIQPLLEKFALPKNKITALQLAREIGKNLSGFEKD